MEKNMKGIKRSIVACGAALAVSAAALAGTTFAWFTARAE